jgi:hypothetical protein
MGEFSIYRNFSIKREAEPLELFGSQDYVRASYMKVRVYFCREPDVQSVILSSNQLSRQALNTIYDLVWECEFKNILNVGRIWLKFAQDEQNPFGIALRKKRSHSKIAPGDIIQVADDYYIVHDVGARKIQIKE